MNYRFPPMTAAFAALGIALATSAPARAGIESCGNIDVEASAECEAVAGVDCTGRCEPVALEAACRGSLEAQCATECTDLPSVDCVGSCESDCQLECEVSPAEFSCTGSCQATCEGDCAASCETAEDGAACEAECSGRCEGECSVSCEGQPAEATCEGKCSASCEGSCNVDLTFNCETECQASGQLDCQADLQGGCELACEDPEGALFCDGNYVDHGGNLAECRAALNAVLTVDVQSSASGSCENNACEGEAQASCQCTAPGRSPHGPTPVGMAALATFLGGLAARRRRP